MFPYHLINLFNAIKAVTLISLLNYSFDRTFSMIPNVIFHEVGDSRARNALFSKLLKSQCKYSTGFSELLKLQCQYSTGFGGARAQNASFSMLLKSQRVYF